MSLVFFLMQMPNSIWKYHSLDTMALASSHAVIATLKTLSQWVQKASRKDQRGKKHVESMLIFTRLIF